MDPLDGPIQVFRVGTHTDAAGQTRTWTEADLDGMVEAHAAQDPVPVVVGHPQMDAPAMGWIDKLWRDGGVLYARLRDLAQEFRDAVHAGRFAQRSVALTRSDAGFQLRHLAFLGAWPAAVEGLEPLRLTPHHFAGPADHVYTFGTTWRGRRAWRIVHDLFRRWREACIAEKGIEAADAMVSEYDLTDLANAARDPDPEDDPAAQDAAFATTNRSENSRSDGSGRGSPLPDDRAGKGETMTAEELAAREADVAAREAKAAAAEAEQTRQREQMEAQQREFAAARERAAAHEAIDPYVRSGQILPAERAGVEALFAAVGDGELTYAAADGQAQVSEPPRVILGRLFGRLKPQVDYGERLPRGEGVHGAQGAPDAVFARREVADRAHVYRQRRQAEGVNLTVTEAVDAVMAGRDRQ